MKQNEKPYDIEALESQISLLNPSESKCRNEAADTNMSLKYVDIVLSSTMVCVLVVGCWRSVWTLMDIYEIYFPMYESFVLGLFIHVVFAMSQTFFHDLLVEKKSNNAISKCLNWVLHKIYFKVFFVANVLHWRSSDYFYNQIYGISEDDGMNFSSIVIEICVLCLILTLLMWIGGITNLIAAPMEVSVDTKSESFLFNYRIFKVIYLAIVLSEQNQISSTTTTNAQNIYTDPIRKSARPFEVKVLGLPPQEFTPTTSTIPPTTKRSTTHYPQLNYYKQHQYPKNIQEVITYMNNRPASNVQPEEPYEINEPVKSSTANINYYKSKSTSGDQFYPYKPTDISEVNLLATGKVRFSPPVWTNFQKFNKHPIPIHNYLNTTNNPEYVTRFPRLIKYPPPSYPPTGVPSAVSLPPNFQPNAPKVGDVVATVRKPMLVNINILPMDGASTQFPGAVGDLQQNGGDSKTRNSMSLQLKVFPDLTYFSEYEKYAAKKDSV